MQNNVDVPDPQPIRSYLAATRTTVTAISRAVGKNRHYVGRAINGYIPAPPDLRADLCALLGVEEHLLFRPLTSSRRRFPGDDRLAAREAGRL